MTSNGRLAKLEGDLALQKSFSEEVKKSQSGNYCFILVLLEIIHSICSIYVNFFILGHSNI